MDVVSAGWTAVLLFILLCLSAGLGRYIRPRLPEEHRNHETVEAMVLMVGMLVTFTALVLGLLTASAKSNYDEAGHDLQEYALQLSQLDQCLRNYGPETAAVRNILKNYTATVIASTWTSEAPPAGVRLADVSGVPRVGPSTALANQLNSIYLALRHLQPTGPFQIAIRDDCLSDYRGVIRAREHAIEDDRSPISRPFYFILVFWLMVIFAAFGLAAPRNGLSLVGLVLSALSLSLSIFVIRRLNHPHFLSFTSADMRAALAQMTASDP